MEEGTLPVMPNLSVPPPFSHNRFIMGRQVAILSLTSAMFLLSMFYRASVAVITPQLIGDLSLDTAGLSLMSAAFFYAFALTQIPLGIFLDHVGPRKTMTALSLIGVVGTLIFAWADSLGMLVTGRVLLGIGMACNLMGAYTLLTRWFSPLYFATFSSLIVAIGTAGSISATSPLVLLVAALGWRWTFSLFAFLNAMLALVFFLVVRDRPDETPVPRRSRPVMKEIIAKVGEAASGLRYLFRDRDYWIISLGCFTRYGILAAFQALWAGPFLMEALGYSALAAGNIILVLNVGMIAGGPFFGILSDRVFRSRKWVAFISLGGSCVIMAVFFNAASGAGIVTLAFLFFSFGFLNVAGNMMYAHIKERMPLEMAGTAMTGINFFNMLGPAFFMQVLGGMMQYLYPHSSFSTGAFRAGFALCFVCLAAVSCLYLFTRDAEDGVRRPAKGSGTTR